MVACAVFKIFTIDSKHGKIKNYLCIFRLNLTFYLLSFLQKILKKSNIKKF